MEINSLTWFLDNYSRYKDTNLSETLDDSEFIKNGTFVKELNLLYSTMNPKDTEGLIDEYSNLILGEYNKIKPNLIFLYKLNTAINELVSSFNQQRKGNESLQMPNFISEVSKAYVEIFKSQLEKQELSLFSYNTFKEITDHNNLLLMNPQPWIELLAYIEKIKVINPRPLFKRDLQGDYRQYFSYNPLKTETDLIKKIFRDGIKTKQLMIANPAIYKPKEMEKLQELIKELLSELREGDEVTLETSVTVIEENMPERLFIKNQEIEPLMKTIIANSPDFEYVRLKKSFRRKGTSLEQMVANLDKLFLEGEKR